MNRENLHLGVKSCRFSRFVDRLLGLKAIDRAEINPSTAVDKQITQSHDGHMLVAKCFFNMKKSGPLIPQVCVYILHFNTSDWTYAAMEHRKYAIETGFEWV